MHQIRVVPENTEVRSRRLERRKASHHIVRIGDALRIGVLRHTPDALDERVVLHLHLDDVHVRPVLVHRHRDHLNPEMLRDGKMAVIPRHRAEEFDLALVAPRLVAAIAIVHAARHLVIHDIQAGIAVNEYTLRLAAEHPRHQPPRLRDALEHTVIAAVNAALAGDIILGRQHVQQTHGQV